MKVLYIGGFCMPDGNAAAQRVLGVAKVLRKLGCEVRFAGLTRNIISGENTGKIDDFAYVNYPYPKGKLWLNYLTGRDKSIWEIDEYKPDIVILYNHPAFAIEYINTYCKKRGIKVLADITEWYEPQGNSLFNAIKGYDIKRRMTHSHKLLDGLICISRYLYDYYKNSGPKLIQLPPLVDLQQEKWHQPVLEKKTILNFVYAGSPGLSKDRLDLIIGALENIVTQYNRKVQFDVIGITQQQYVISWGDTRSYSFVTFHGYIPHNEVIRFLLNADFQIFLRPDNLPNRAGFPTKFVETITSSTLPITNLCSNLSDYLVDGKNGFVIESIDGNQIEKTLNRAIGLSQKDLHAIDRLPIDSFDYNNYVDVFDKFLKNL